MSGYKNRLLRVDLTNRTFSEQSLGDDLAREYVGGRGFGAKLLYDDLRPGVDPYGEENELIFLTGPVTGTTAQSFSRWKVFFKSPLTGGHFRSSGGGFFAAELKFAGFDGVVLSGIADRPVYLWIHDGQYELRDAAYLWGLRCSDTHALIRQELGDPRIRLVCIGPAGENRVRYAGIFTDLYTAGRGGGGAVMGAKNLKAVAVRGRERVAPADPDAFAAAVKEQVRTYQTHHSFPSFSAQGTQNPEFTNVLGMFPTRNFQEGVLEGFEQLEAPEYAKIRVRNEACYSCAIHCRSLTKVPSGPYAGAWTEGPEYESIWAFTGAIGSSEIGLTVAGDHLCDELGLDTISAAGTISFAYELFERGILTGADTGGLELRFGNHAPVLPLLRQIAFRQGIGDLLAEGTRLAARRIGKGADYYAIHSKGLELPAYDPRGAKSHGLNLMTTSIGADHNSGYGQQEIFGTPWKVERFGTYGKAALTKRNQDISAIRDCGIMCGFAALFLEDLSIYGKLLAAASGIKALADPDYLMHVGERINNLERLFNVREGFRREDDSLPTRFMVEPLPSGPSAGQIFEAESLLADYYLVRGWDAATGIPTTGKLDELGLGSLSR